MPSLKPFTVDAQVNKEGCYLVNWTCLNKSGESNDVTHLAMQNHWLPTQGLEQDPTHKQVRTSLWDIILMTG